MLQTRFDVWGEIDECVIGDLDVVTESGSGLVIEGWTEKAGGDIVDFFVNCWTYSDVDAGTGFVIKGWTEGTDSRFVDVFVDCFTCNVVDAGAGLDSKGCTEKTEGAVVDFFVDCWMCNDVDAGVGFVNIFVDCWTCSVVDAGTCGFVECCVEVYDDIWSFVVFAVIWFFSWPLLEPTVNISFLTK